MPRGWLTCKMIRIFLFLFLPSLVLLGCQQQPETIQLHGSTMGTTWSVSLHSPPGDFDSAAVKKQLQQRLDEINRQMSTYDPDSEVSRFNRSSSSDWFAVSAETARVVDLSLQISRMTAGAFDISVGPLVELWGFGARDRGDQLPTDDQIATALASTGYRKLEVRPLPAALRKAEPRLQIDLSAVAKGYAVDQLAELLKQQQVNNFLVEVGGELQIAGKRSDGSPWRIAIEQPLEGVREVGNIFPLTDVALATSGNYRNFYIENGQRYAHTIDPHSGRPIVHRLASVTVLDKDCARADALATALMVMGEVAGQHFVEKNQLAVFFLIHDGEAFREYRSPSFQAFLDGEVR